MESFAAQVNGNVVEVEVSAALLASRKGMTRRLGGYEPIFRDIENVLAALSRHQSLVRDEQYLALRDALIGIESPSLFNERVADLVDYVERVVCASGVSQPRGGAINLTTSSGYGEGASGVSDSGRQRTRLEVR